MSAPLLSVLLSVHEPGPHLEESLDSLARQTFADYELLIVCDGAPEPLRRELALRALRDPRVRLVEQERRGLTPSLNHALSLARGRYCARQDADDVSLPERFERQLALLERTGADLASCHTEIVDEHGRLMARRTPPESGEALRRELELYNCIQHSTIMFRADRARALGGYRDRFVFSQDYDLYLRALTAGWTFAVLPSVAMKIRMTQSNITTVHRRSQLGYAMAAQADYFAREGASPLRAMLAMRHHALRWALPDPLRRAKRRLTEAFR